MSSDFITALLLSDSLPSDFASIIYLLSFSCYPIFSNFFLLLFLSYNLLLLLSSFLDSIMIPYGFGGTNTFELSS